ncbi:uncharacterized protein LOC143893762 [Temnothorax americanus]|uniref:uncharacterized protein LOC143893762 n=1 Tax=Temnothorax americanus TaxID=1964332 RepID=UPI004068A221
MAKRQARATSQQIEALVTYLEQHPHVASGKFYTLEGKNTLQGNWEELAKHLNSLTPNEKVKDYKSWKITWRDLKSKVSDKVQKLRKGRAATGNNPVNIVLSELDKRILGIIGHEYVQGLSDVPDSFPEEYTNAVETLAAGNEDVLRNVPGPIIISELPNESGGTNNLEDEDDFDEPNILIFSHESNISSTLQSASILSTSQSTSIPSTLHSRTIPSTLQSETRPTTSQSTNILENILPNAQSSRQDISSSAQSIRTRRTSSTRLGVQLHEARQSFENIADKHAEAMRMLAEAMKLQAEALVTLGQAIEKFTNRETNNKSLTH